jgi:hypothetical protein
MCSLHAIRFIYLTFPMTFFFFDTSRAFSRTSTRVRLQSFRKKCPGQLFERNHGHSECATYIGLHSHHHRIYLPTRVPKSGSHIFNCQRSTALHNWKRRIDLVVSVCSTLGPHLPLRFCPSQPSIYHVLTLSLFIQYSGVACYMTRSVMAPLTYLILLICSYLHAHDMIRGITGYGTGHGPYIAIHEGFAGQAQWANFLPNSDRIALDVHPYLAFGGSTQSTVIAADGSPYAAQACGWGPEMSTRYGFSSHIG